MWHEFNISWKLIAKVVLLLCASDLQNFKLQQNIWCFPDEAVAIMRNATKKSASEFPPSSSRSKKFATLTEHPEGLLAGIAIGASAGVLVLAVFVSFTDK